jgi:glycosyltransferase involved in cell wall biosynthesis
LVNHLGKDIVPMRVLYDALGLPLYGGAKSSALGWIRSVAEIEPEYEFVVLVSDFEPALQRLKNLEQVVVPNLNRFRVRLWAQMHLARIVRARGIDLVHFTKNLGCVLVPCPTVITINDLNRLHYPAMYSRVDVLYWKTVQRAVLRDVDRVITISENSKQDLVRFYHLPPEKILVIYPAVASHFHHHLLTSQGSSAILQKYGIRPPYILSVGGLAAHKNVYTALAAFYSLHDQGFIPDHTFVVVGERFHTHSDRRLLDVAGRDIHERVCFTGVVADEDLPAIYKGASLFVYPSLYEGFGIAPIESMSCGVPVLASQNGSLPEVLGEAAWLVDDPTDVDALAEGILRILTDSAVWEKLRKRGLENARRFSWSQTAKETLALYTQLVGS